MIFFYVPKGTSITMILMLKCVNNICIIFLNKKLFNPTIFDSSPYKCNIFSWKRSPSWHIAESIPRRTKKMYEYKQTSFAFEGKFNKNNYLFLQEQDKFQTNTCVQENLGKFLLRTKDYLRWQTRRHLLSSCLLCIHQKKLLQINYRLRFLPFPLSSLSLSFFALSWRKWEDPIILSSFSLLSFLLLAYEKLINQ